jgi:hypothetical protein
LRAHSITGQFVVLRALNSCQILRHIFSCVVLGQAIVNRGRLYPETAEFELKPAARC